MWNYTKEIFPSVFWIIIIISHPFVSRRHFKFFCCVMQKCAKNQSRKKCQKFSSHPLVIVVSHEKLSLKSILWMHNFSLCRSVSNAVFQVCTKWGHNRNQQFFFTISKISSKISNFSILERISLAVKIVKILQVKLRDEIVSYWNFSTAEHSQDLP